MALIRDWMEMHTGWDGKADAIVNCFVTLPGMQPGDGDWGFMALVVVSWRGKDEACIGQASGGGHSFQLSQT
jgi:hypothetical protein